MIKKIPLPDLNVSLSLCHSSLCPLELQFFQLYKRKRTNERSGVQSLVFNGSSLLPSFRFSSFISLGKWGIKEGRRHACAPLVSKPLF